MKFLALVQEHSRHLGPKVVYFRLAGLDEDPRMAGDYHSHCFGVYVVEAFEHSPNHGFLGNALAPVKVAPGLLLHGPVDSLGCQIRIASER